MQQENSRRIQDGRDLTSQTLTIEDNNKSYCNQCDYCGPYFAPYYHNLRNPCKNNDFRRALIGIALSAVLKVGLRGESRGIRTRDTRSELF